MASLVEEIAGALALDVIRAAQGIGGDSLVDDVAKVIGGSSTTTQEAFLTAVRDRLSAQLARRLLGERIGRREGQNATRPGADGPALAGHSQDMVAEETEPSQRARPDLFDSDRPDPGTGEVAAVVRSRLPPVARGPAAMNSPAVSPSSAGLARALAESLAHRSDLSTHGYGHSDDDRA
jgi:hypothetical protein